jgi:hypothetical protein
MLHNCSTKSSIADDIDSILESIQPPSELLVSLKPLPTCTVAQLLAMQRPSRPGSRKYFLEPTLWFTAEKPNYTPVNISDLVLPSETLCEILDSHLRAAIQKGMSSVQHPVKTGIFLPFWAVRAWKWGNVLVKKQSIWTAHLTWVRRTADAEEWSEGLREKVNTVISGTPWHTGFKALQNGTVSTTVLAGLLSDDWVNDDIINCIGDVIIADMKVAGVDPHIQLASSALSYTLEHPGTGGSEKYWGERLKSGETKRLLIQYNIPNIHWLSVEIDVPKRLLNFGDSKPSVTNKAFPVLAAIVPKLTKWLDFYLPGMSWRTNLTGIKVPLQLDSKSCGIATPSGIHHYIIPTVALWNPHKPGKARANYFCRCVTLGQGVCVFNAQQLEYSSLTRSL